MEVLSLVLVVADLICTLVLVFCLFHVLRWALSRVSEWREASGGTPWSARRCFVFALLAALSFIL